MSVELVALLIWLIGPPLLFAMLVVFYPPYLRRRIGRRDVNSGVVFRLRARAGSDARRDSTASSRASQASGT